jgi:hypothetical protein
MAKEDWKETWETETGLPDDFDFWITRSEFSYLPDQYTDTQGRPLPLLIWYGESDEGFDGPVTFSLGKGWEPSRDGRTVTNEKKKKFVDTSMIGRLINRAKELGAVDVLAERGPVTDASVWEGLGFHMKREEFEYKGLLQDKGGKTSRLMPTAFLGVRGEAKSANPAQPAAEAKAESAQKDELLVKRLKLMAQKFDRSEFQKKAMDMPEVLEDQDLFNSIIDDTNEGFWAKARAEG